MWILTRIRMFNFYLKGWSAEKIAERAGVKLEVVEEFIRNIEADKED